MATFDNIDFPTALPEDFWITDTTFRDGQQAGPPYSIEQTRKIFEFLHKLSGPSGVIRQSEFFLFSERDRRAFEACREFHFEFPEMTTWIRASAKDIELIKNAGVKETGILTSVSDYHIFLKLNSDRRKILDSYLGIVKDILAAGIKPRCHFEDVTRADIYGFVLPFAEELKKLADESKVPIKIRLCDTMGYGLPFVASTLPRSVPKLVYLFREAIGFSSEQLEWHGHNDFHLVTANSLAFWLYGGASINGTLLGFGERTGNTPIEGLLINYISLKGHSSGIDTEAITEMAEYFRNELGTHIPDNYPFVGAKFNYTRAGIHADGVIKNEEIYNIFDTQRILNRPIGIAIADKAGVAGIALWINMHYKLKGDKEVDKRHPGIAKMNEKILKEYEDGRMTAFSDEELEKLVQRYLPEVVPSEFDRIMANVEKHMLGLAEQTALHPEIISLDPVRMVPFLENFIEENKVIQLIVVTDTKGKKICHVCKLQDKALFHNFTREDFSDSEWFAGPIKDGKSHVTEFYTSKYTGELCITVAVPIMGKNDKMAGILSFDIQFEEAAKLE
jgi:isopropylmalate/homocitrate/citramalate synthase